MIAISAIGDIGRLPEGLWSRIGNMARSVSDPRRCVKRRPTAARSCALPPEAVVSMQRCRSRLAWPASGCGDQRQDRAGARGERLRVGRGPRRRRPTRARRKSRAAWPALGGSRPGASTAWPPRARTASACCQRPLRDRGQGRGAARAAVWVRRFDSPVGPGRSCGDRRGRRLWLGEGARPAASAVVGVSSGVAAGAGARGEAGQVVRPAGLWPGARQPLAAEGLAADHRADLVAVDIGVADLEPRRRCAARGRRCGCAGRRSGRSRWR